MLPLKILAIAIMAILPVSAHAATPAFSVHKNGTNQTVAQDTDVKLTWSTEGFDTNNNFATDRFTPTVAGKYLIVVSTQCAQAGACMPSIFKNGALAARSANTNINIGQTEQATAIVDMNGTTDYVEAFINSASSVINGTATRTYFSGMQLDGSGGGGGGTPAGSTGDIQFNTGGAFDADTGQLFWDKTNNRLGIGTSNPSYRLHIGGETAQFPTSLFIAATGHATSRRAAIGLDNWLILQDPNGSGTKDFSIWDSDDGATRLLISASGNVGIGTTSSLSKLSLGGVSDYSNRIALYETISSDFRGIGMCHPGTSPDYWGVCIWANQTPSDTNAYLFVKDGGNVGIGTASPASRLQVAGGIQLADDTGACPGASNVKLGTLRFNSGALQVCVAGGWAGVGSTGAGTTMYPNFPDAILCTTGSELRYLTLHFVDGGLADYRQPSAGANDGVKYNASTGAYNSQSGMGSSDCVTGTKSIATLYAEGKAFNFIGSSLASAAAPPGGVQFNNGSGSLAGDTALVWDNTNKRLGIGTTTPAEKLEIYGSGSPYIKVTGTSVDVPVGVKIYSYGSNTAARSIISLESNDTPGGGGTVRMQSALSANSTNVTQIPSANGGANNALQLFTISSSPLQLGTANSARMTIDTSGNVGVGTPTPNQGKLEVKGGTVCVDTNSDDNATSCITAESDVRLKKNIEVIPHALATLDKLRGVLFDWRWDEYPAIADFKAIGRDAGVIAQEVEAAYPQGMGEEVNGFKTVRYDRLVPLLIQSVKELKADNDNLRAELKAANDNHAAEIEELSSEIKSLQERR